MPEFDNGIQRRLSFPLSKSVSPITEGGDLGSPFSITPDWQTTDNNEIVTITLDLTLNEFVALASTIDAGRDIAYGDESIEIWKIWTRAVNTMAICEQIAQCILNNQSVQDALKITINNPNLGILPPNVAQPTLELEMRQPAVSAGNILPSCNPDNIFGLTRQLTQFSINLVTDTFQIIEVATNSAEAAAIMSDSVPILSESLLPLSKIQPQKFGLLRSAMLTGMI
jgi:hypothetical protein